MPRNWLLLGKSGRRRRELGLDMGDQGAAPDLVVAGGTQAGFFVERGRGHGHLL
jgi:hypothetical protein